MINIIAAISKNYCIGNNNKLPWHISEDLQHFKNITNKKTVLMGRKTFESIIQSLGKPLTDRTNVVITKNTEYTVPAGVEMYNNIKDAIKKHNNEEIFIIGGGEIYEQTINLADKLYITWVDKEINGDTFFPKIEDSKWKEETREKYDGFSFVRYIKQ